MDRFGQMSVGHHPVGPRHYSICIELEIVVFLLNVRIDFGYMIETLPTHLGPEGLFWAGYQINVCSGLARSAR